MKKAFNGERGSSWEFPVYNLLEPATDTIDQNADVTPVTSTDVAVNISIAEYANVVRESRLLKATAYTDVHAAAAKLVAENFTRSSELLIRSAFIGGTWNYRPGGVARTSLARATATHLITSANLANIMGLWRGMNCPMLSGGGVAGICHPMLIAGLLQDSVITLIGEYSPGFRDADLLKGEVGQFQGVRFVDSPWAKVYFGGGTVAQGATTTAAAITAGATSFTITSATGIAVGDTITVGALETANTEAVQVTAVSGTTITIMGVGNTETGNMGFKYAHANGAAVTEAQHVGSLVLVGEQSVGMVYSSFTGPNGRIKTTVPTTNVPDRFTDFSWYWLAGVGRIGEKYILRAEFAMPVDFIGIEQKPT